MTATQKLIAYRAGLPSVQAGQVIRIPTNWIIASELALKGMLVTHRQLGEPDLADPDHFYLAVDHTVSPWRGTSLDAQHQTGRDLAVAAAAFARRYQLRRYSGPNDSILHTKPYEQFFLPGDVVVGADSHSTFHGGLGAFSIGLGAADVMTAAVLGATLLRLPETVRINIEGKLPPYLVGKDLILYILQKFGRNTIAFERVVEYGGEGMTHLTASDRGTLCNMGAEFGCIASFCEPDEVIARFIRTRLGEFNEGGLYFHADPDAPYERVETVRLTDDMAPKVALEPGPENVADIDTLLGKPIDIAFVGSCTTTPREFVLGAFMAKAALAAGRSPIPVEGQRGRFVAPSSMDIARMLQRFDLVKPLEDLGFKVGLAGCSYCLGVDGDGAPAGFTLMGSHNRTFKDRVGRGAHSMAASAATVVASSVDMRVADPRELMSHFDREGYERVVAELSGASIAIPEITLAEPSAADLTAAVVTEEDFDFGELKMPGVVRSKVIRFGDNVDTDAIIAGRFCHLPGIRDLGLHAFENAMGEGAFRRKVEDEGHGIVVGGVGWGSGSSREEAVYALQGAGVQLVIARNIAFIHLRNLVNQALPFRLIHPEDQEALYNAMKEGTEVEVDLANNIVRIPANRTRKKRSIFRLLPIHPVEQAIQSLGGLAAAYNRFGRERTLSAILALARRLETTQEA